MSKKNISLFFGFYVVQLTALYAIFFTEVNWLYLFLGWIIFCGLGSATILHRYVSHKSIELKSWLEKPLLLLATLCAQGTPIWWAGVHRGMHHKHSDREGDPHSPKDGVFHAYIGWLHSKEIDNINPRHVKDIYKDSFHLFLNKYYVHIIWSFLITGMFVAPQFTLWFWIVPAAWSFHQEAIVNISCHSGWFGYRTYNTEDNSYNLQWLALFTWGQALHNNHHNESNTYSFARKDEFDPTIIFKALIEK